MTFDEALTEVLYERERILYESAVNNSELSSPHMGFDKFMEKFTVGISIVKIDDSGKNHQRMLKLLSNI